jgi:DNA-binding SARP family transcriptional activator/Tfp pilus assembly protein PilF/TolB-like protein
MSQLLTLGRVRLIAPEGAEPAAATQPKRMALLVYLALASAHGSSRRDALLALFWPELADEEGRRALRQGLYFLRRVLGQDAFLTEGDEVRVREGALGCDAVDFERMLDDGQPEQALALYRGDFLGGFHVDDVAAEYEEWVVRTRARLRRRAATAAWSSAESAEAAGNAGRALELARRSCELEPDQEAGWRRLMALHQRLGDSAGALRTYDELVERLEREFAAQPAPETQALASRIRGLGESQLRGSAGSEVRGIGGSEAPGIEGSQVRAFGDSQGADDLGKTGNSDAARQPASPRAHGPARLHKRALIGFATFLALVVAGVAYFSLRDARAEPSLLSAGTLARTDRLLVADFANLGADSLLAAAVTEVLRVDLSQSPYVTVLTPRQVRSTLVRMERKPETAVDDSVAREVALRMGVKAFVSGSVARAASAYTVTVRLVDARSGEVLVAHRERASDSTRLIDAVDRASKQVRYRIGESLRELRDVPPLSTEVTASLAALRKYTEAEQLTLAGKRSEAIERYEEAIVIDSAFAGAWSAMAMAHESVGNLGQSRMASQQAIRHKNRLPFIQRSFLQASYSYSHGDYDTSIETYGRLLDRYPDNYNAINNLALVYQRRRQFATAESLFTRAAEIDSTIANFYFGIEGNQLLQGKFVEARRTLDLIARRFPGNPILLNVEIQWASAQHRWDDAERRAEALIAAVQGDTSALVDPFEALGLMASTQGRLKESERLWRTHQRLSAASGAMGRHMFGVIRRAGIELRYRNRPARALEIIDSALARRPLDSLLPADRPYDELARINAVAGRLDRARQFAAAADANDRTLERQQLAERNWTRGVIALAEGRAAAAEALLRIAAEQHSCTICVLPDLGRAYEAVEKPSAATAVYARYVTTPWFWRYETDALELGPVLERLAALYDASGEREKASGARARLVQLWRGADAELQPAVARARQGVGGAGR